MKNVICLLVLLLLFSCNGKPGVRSEKKEIVDIAALALDSAEKVMNNDFSVKLLNKRYISGVTVGYIEFFLKVKNTSDYPVKAAKGTVIFSDMFDEEITSYEYMYDDKILTPGDHVFLFALTNTSELKNSKDIIDKELTSLKINWSCRSILFENDSVVNKDDLVELFKKKLGE